jgi:hypothetical protein
MTTILKPVNRTVNSTYGTGTTVTIPPLTSGQIYTTNTTGTTFSWQNPNENVMIVKQDPASLEVKGRMIINGVDLEERLKTIERVLTIPERDVILEKKHPKLKKLYDEYIAALGKYRTFEAIKGDDNGTT